MFWRIWSPSTVARPRFAWTTARSSPPGTFEEWCGAREIVIRYIQPGKPDQNAYIERFNRSYRHEVLDAYVFSSLAEVRVVTEDWIADYNTARPRDSLGRVPPLTFLPRSTSIREYAFNMST